MTLSRIFIIFIYILALNNIFKFKFVNAKQGRGVNSKCHSSDLPEGVKIQGPCSFLRNKLCRASCRFGGTTLWRKDIKCTSSGHWSLGHNKCSPRGHSAHFEVIPCPQLIEQLPGEKKCIKISQPGKSKPKIDVCPELLRIYVQLDKCRRVGKGECAVSCLEDAFSLLCIAKGVWYPNCRVSTHKTLCPAKLPPSKLLDCSRTPGSECKLRCPDGNIDPKKILCSPTGQWTRLPKCHFRKCPHVGKRKDENAVLTSCPRTFNSFCRYKCNKGLTPTCEMKCNGNGHWKGSICCTRRCSQLGKQEFETKNSCSGQLDSTCKVRCKSGGGQSWTDVRCVGKGVWSGLPVCKRCSTPNVRDATSESTKRCKGKTPGENCKIVCQQGYSLKGNPVIKCTDQLEWTDRPKCVQQCPVPKLSDNNLKTSGSCTGKVPGDTCTLECAQGGQIIGEGTIRCLVNSTWSHMPGCFCPIPSLTGDLAVQPDGCNNKKPNEICKLRCKERAMTMTGDDYITCSSETKWSRLPTCGNAYCPPPSLDDIDRRVLTLRPNDDCSRKAVHETCPLECVKGGSFVGEGHIKCLGNQKWSRSPDCSCPETGLFDNVELSSTCSFARNETCNVKCKSGYKTSDRITTITCLNDLSWSSQPTCMKLCPKPKLAENNLRSAENCAEMAAGSTCSLSCVEGGKLKGSQVIECLQTGEWTAFPECCCPPPTLTGDLTAKGNCNELKVRERCELGCRNTTSRLTGDRFLVCNSDTRWSQLPTCSSTLCPPPSFANSVVKSKEDCPRKAIGQTCFLECSKGGNVTGSDHIRCLENQTWSPLPNCTCPSPNLKENVELAAPCVNATKDMLCSLKCKSGYQIVGGTHITCMDDLSWYDPANVQCKKRCPEPKLAENHLVSTSSCSGKFVGDTCEVRCATGGKIVGSNTSITCIGDGKWTSFPLCYCPTPKVPSEISTSIDCDKIRPSEICKYHCVDSSLSISGDKATCQLDLTWDFNAPRCYKACSKPTFSDGVLTLLEDCEHRAGGGKCKVSCTNGGTLIGDSDSIKCLDSGDWDVFPRCTCPRPEFRFTLLKSAEDCSMKKPFETCKLTCGLGYRTIDMKDTSLQCESDAKWAKIPSCHRVCPDTVPGDEFDERLLWTCKNRIGGEQCTLQCRYNSTLIFPTCNQDGSWTVPQCRQSCPDILTAPLQYVLPEHCKDKKEGDTCNVNCGEGGLVVLNNYFVTCQSGGQWSNYPKCQCDYPRLPNAAYVMGDCSWDGYGSCRVLCLDDPTTYGYITCNETYWWSNPSFVCNMYTVVLKRCILLTTDSRYAHRFAGSEAMYGVPECPDPVGYGNQWCKLKCKFGIMSGSPWAECRNGEWVNVNECNCTAQMVKFGNSCISKRPGDSCDVYCNYGYKRSGGSDTVKCMNNAQWSHMPGCSKCPEYWGSDSSTTVKCSPKGPEGELKCDVQCSGGEAAGGEEFTSSCFVPTKTPNLRMNYYDPEGSDTIIDPYWSPPLKCEPKCGNPVIDSRFLIEGPRNHKVGGRLMMTCSNPSVRPRGYLLCQDNLNWIWEHPIDCPAAQGTGSCTAAYDWLRSLEWLIPDEDCQYKGVGETCQVTCANRGRFPNGSTTALIRCQEDGQWSALQMCQCMPLYMGLHDLYQGACFLFINSTCSLSCKRHPEMKSSVTCDTRLLWVWNPPIDCEGFCPDIPDRYSDPPPKWITLDQNCTNKKPGDTCQVRCANEGLIVKGTNILTCQNNKEWTSYPKCKCAAPTLDSRFQVSYPCIVENFMCTVVCLSEPGKYASIQCEINLKWKWLNQLDCASAPPAWGQPSGFRKRSYPDVFQKLASTQLRHREPRFQQMSAGVFGRQTWMHSSVFQKKSNPAHILETVAEFPQPAIQNQLSAPQFQRHASQFRKSISKYEPAETRWQTSALQKRSDPAQFKHLVPRFQKMPADESGRQRWMHPSVFQKKGNPALFHESAAQIPLSATQIQHTFSISEPSETWWHSSFIQKRNEPAQFKQFAGESGRQIWMHFSALKKKSNPAQFHLTLPRFQRFGAQIQRPPMPFQPSKTSVVRKRDENLCRDEEGQCDELVFCPPILSAPGDIDFYMAHVLVPMQDCSAVPSGGICIVRCRNGRSVRGGGPDVKVPLGGGVMAGKMFCGGDGVWSAPYFCRCPKPNHSGITDVTAEHCKDTLPYLSCAVKCSEGFRQRLVAIWCNDFGFWKQGQEPCVFEEDFFEIGL
ncbi:hypothetical protein JTE90_003536 [Oedothorax gibbosus]|uniref:Sushi domain-containing protein n=1 Tax=Oedothorax gibbosus TaxID=931172 RepID=A0AAV6UQR5_9ARAC|nr:hypothetical protein JTE90_003536 [Oedothorax gibbosus]